MVLFSLGYTGQLLYFWIIQYGTGEDCGSGLELTVSAFDPPERLTLDRDKTALKARFVSDPFG